MRHHHITTLSRPANPPPPRALVSQSVDPTVGAGRNTLLYVMSLCARPRLLVGHVRFAIVQNVERMDEAGLAMAYYNFGFQNARSHSRSRENRHRSHGKSGQLFTPMFTPSLIPPLPLRRRFQVPTCHATPWK
jgi:hypothetical protein